jgi:hypothetical protein
VGKPIPQGTALLLSLVWTLDSRPDQPWRGQTFTDTFKPSTSRFGSSKA